MDCLPIYKRQIIENIKKSQAISISIGSSKEIALLGRYYALKREANTINSTIKTVKKTIAWAIKNYKHCCIITEERHVPYIQSVLSLFDNYSVGIIAGRNYWETYYSIYCLNFQKFFAICRNSMDKTGMLFNLILIVLLLHSFCGFMLSSLLETFLWEQSPACNAIKSIFDGLPDIKIKAIVWLIPSDVILPQTLATLRNPNHSYRMKINTASGGQVEVYTKEPLLSGQNFNIITAGE